MDRGDDRPPHDDVDNDLIDLDDFEHDGRLFVVARIAPHPTAIRAIFEVADDGDPEPKSASELVTETSEPYFWVERYGGMLHDYVHKKSESASMGS